MSRLVGGQYRRYSPWKIIPSRSPSDSLFSLPARLLAGSIYERGMPARETGLSESYQQQLVLSDR